MKKIVSGVRVYTVVEVMRGVAVGAYSFRRLQDALFYAERLREGRNLQEDDIQLFRDSIGHHDCRNSITF